MRHPIARAAGLVFCGTVLFAQTRPAPQPAAVAVTMRNVMYHFTGRIAVHIYELSGWLTPAGQNPFPIFDDARSFVLHIDAANMSITQGFTLTYKRPQQTKTEGKRIKSGQRSARVGVRRRHRVLPLNREQPQITASNSNVVRNSLKTWAAPYERRRDNEKSDSPNFKWTVAIPAIPPMHCATMYAGTSRRGGHIQGHRRT